MNTDTPELADRTTERLAAPAAGRLPPALLAALGECVAATAAGIDGEAAARLERWGLQWQAIARILAHAAQLRRESVDLGLALLQTQAEWSAEAAHAGVDVHGPACSVAVDTNPAALKQLLDLLLEHALQQGHTVRIDVAAVAGDPYARVVVMMDSAPATSAPARDTLAWQLLVVLARALSLAPERRAVPGGERIELALPRSAT